MKPQNDPQLALFLAADPYVDFHDPRIRACAASLFRPEMDPTEKARAAYEFVRDQIPHSFDCNAAVITARASQVLKYKTGICHAKSNLLAALLRSQEIPTGFCFARITLVEDDSLGYCVHAFNAVWLQGTWVKLDARGNKEGINAQFSLEEPLLAYLSRPSYDEYFFPGIYAHPHAPTMAMLEQAKSLQDIMDNIPDMVTEPPDLPE